MCNHYSIAISRRAAKRAEIQPWNLQANQLQVNLLMEQVGEVFVGVAIWLVRGNFASFGGWNRESLPGDSRSAELCRGGCGVGQGNALPPLAVFGLHSHFLYLHQLPLVDHNFSYDSSKHCWFAGIYLYPWEIQIIHGSLFFSFLLPPLPPPTLLLLFLSLSFILPKRFVNIIIHRVV